MLKNSSVPYHPCVWAQTSAIQPGTKNYCLWKGKLLPTVYLTCTEFAPKAAENNWGKDFHLAQSLSENTFKTTQKIFPDQNRNLHSRERLPGHTQNKKKMDTFSIAGRLIVVRTQYCNLLM